MKNQQNLRNNIENYTEEEIIMNYFYLNIYKMDQASLIFISLTPFYLSFRSIFFFRLYNTVNYGYICRLLKNL